MKYFILAIVAIIITTFTGCKKDTGNKSMSTSIAGTWELRKLSGMIPMMEYPAGNGNTFKFSGSTYEKYSDGNLVKSGHYTVVNDLSAQESVGLVIKPGQFTQRIIFDNDYTSAKTFIDLSSNQLTFMSGYFPLDSGSFMVYEKTPGNP